MAAPPPAPSPPVPGNAGARPAPAAGAAAVGGTKAAQNRAAYDLLDRKDPTDFENTSTEPYFRCPVCGKETCRWQTFFSSKHNCNMLWARCSAFDPLQEAFVCKFAAYHPRNLATIRPRAPAGLLVWALEYHTLILFFVKEPL